jgi:hypothetical protein
MKNDHLEQFIIDKRDDFDLAEVPEGLFEKIDRPEKKVTRINWGQIAWRAAAVVLIFTASWFIHDLVNRDSLPAITSEEPSEISPLYKEFAEAEIYYSAMIKQKRDMVFELTKDDPAIFEEINTELIELDQVYKELKNDLGDNADNEQVIEALIQNYRLKLDILEEMLYVLRKAQDKENNTDYENNSREI